MASMMSLGSIVLEERRKPGRKLLFWLSPGWSGSWDNAFHDVTVFSTGPREVRVALVELAVPAWDFT